MTKSSGARRAGKTRTKNRARQLVSEHDPSVSMGTSRARGIVKAHRGGRRKAARQMKAGARKKVLYDAAQKAGKAAVATLKKKKAAIRKAMPGAKKAPELKAVIYIGNKKKAVMFGKASSQGF